ncbi:MAG: homocysteine S-methyltransferase family protein [Caldilineaceae bacterium]
MSRYRQALPQLGGDIFLADAGIETDLIFNHGIEIRSFAAHTLLPDRVGKQAIIDYFRGFLSLAQLHNTGYILDSVTWKAHPHWAADLGASEEELQEANHASIALMAQLREEFAANAKPIVLNGIIGPKGDAYAPEREVAIQEAEQYHAKQIGWLAATAVDMVTALTFTQADEASGLVLAARSAGLPVVVSFTVETDGRLPTGQPLGEAIEAVDQATDAAVAYFMVNCAHPEHFAHLLGDTAWARRIRGIRCNASRKSHAELDESTTLDAGDPVEMGQQYAAIRAQLPWLNVFGGCCGSDLRHVTQIARALLA